MQGVTRVKCHIQLFIRKYVRSKMYQIKTKNRTGLKLSAEPVIGIETFSINHTPYRINKDKYVNLIFLLPRGRSYELRRWKKEETRRREKEKRLLLQQVSRSAGG